MICYLADKRKIVKDEWGTHEDAAIVPYKPGRTRIIELEEDEEVIVNVVFVGELGTRTEKVNLNIPEIVRVVVLEEDYSYYQENNEEPEL